MNFFNNETLKRIFKNAIASAQRTNMLGLGLLIIGAIIVYSSNNIVKIFGWKSDEMNIVKVKLLGLTVAIIGILKIFGTI